MQTPALNSQIIEEVSQIFQALGDVSRLKILQALLESGEPLCQGTLMSKTGLSQANASKHLTQLVRTGIVTREPQGNLVNFRLSSALAESVCSLVCGHVASRIRNAYDSLIP